MHEIKKRDRGYQSEHSDQIFAKVNKLKRLKNQKLEILNSHGLSASTRSIYKINNLIIESDQRTDEKITFIYLQKIYL